MTKTRLLGQQVRVADHRLQVYPIPPSMYRLGLRIIGCRHTPSPPPHVQVRVAAVAVAGKVTVRVISVLYSMVY